MVKVRDEHPLLHDGSLDVDGWLAESRAGGVGDRGR